MSGGDQLFIFAGLGAALGRAWGSVLLRPYVFGFLAVFLAAAARDLGLAARGRRSPSGPGAWRSPPSTLDPHRASRSGSTTTPGRPRGAELFLSNVPFFDSAVLHVPRLRESLAGRAAPRRRGRGGPARTGARLRLAGLAGLLMMWLDIVIDPLAVRGDRWFLGRIFYYPEPGWLLRGAASELRRLGARRRGDRVGLDDLGPRVGGARPAWGMRWPEHGRQAVALYYSCWPSTWRSRRWIGEWRFSASGFSSTCRWQSL